MIIEYFIYFTSLLIITYIANKKSFLPNYRGNIHQKFLNTKNTPLIGGFFLLISIIKIFYDQSFFYNLVFVSIFFIGFCSDTKLISSPKLRLFIQILIISFFTFHFDIHVTPTRIEIIDEFLQNNIFSLFFSIFCFIILMNGSNFIDGLNGLLLGYVLILFFNLNIENLILITELSKIKVYFLIFSLIVIISLNYLNYLYLGDGGSYLIALLTGYILVTYYNSSSAISPYYIILLLWYPCFEILFSLIRKFIKRKSPMEPDNQHLHQLIFLYYKIKFKNKKDIISNTSASLTINFFNFIIFFIASKNPNLTLLQVELIFLATFIYCLIYFLLKKKLKLFFKK